ncbi:hypothetical protein FB565_008668 [Actinoplanes lutulentus]|uniref:Uncharacterized protein n=1 Tax=Actinoplanes lutulentus TaxID=1287878 RepID=A0A327Z3E4_9ACTN|nr:hypothetical protein [Actinoplanes lutulentus]MBB2948882.1 hypothetical protein [Actinoplanes lutulentus]RAK29792.1 hypothetical protein B0I29_117118 [Actinoplanes lutulentus]
MRERTLLATAAVALVAAFSLLAAGPPLPADHTEADSLEVVVIEPTEPLWDCPYL